MGTDKEESKPIEQPQSKKEVNKMAQGNQQTQHEPQGYVNEVPNGMNYNPQYPQQYNSMPPQNYGAPQMMEKPIEVQQASFQPLNAGFSQALPKNIDLIMDVPLEVSVVLGRTRLNIREILNLGTGSLIELDKLAEEPVEILVNGKKVAYGEVVVVDENFGVRITSIVSNEEKIKSLGKQK